MEGERTRKTGGKVRERGRKRDRGSNADRLSVPRHRYLPLLLSPLSLPVFPLEEVPTIPSKTPGESRGLVQVSCTFQRDGKVEGSPVKSRRPTGMMVSAGATPTTPRDSQSRPRAEGLPAIRKLSSCQVWLCLALHDINLEFKVLKRRYSLQLAAPPFRCSNGSSAVSPWNIRRGKRLNEKGRKRRRSSRSKSKALIIIFYRIFY